MKVRPRLGGGWAGDGVEGVSDCAASSWDKFAVSVLPVTTSYA